jgi:hypothetical protein
MARWTKDGWELLEGIALNAYAFTGFKASALKVMEDATRVCGIVEANPGIGKMVKNVFGEDRFWHPFHDGKVLIWKLDDDGVMFVGAYYSIPYDLVV